MTQEAPTTRKRLSQASAIAWLWKSLSHWSLAKLWRFATLLGPQVDRLSKRERRVTDINLEVVYPDTTPSERKALAKQSLKHSAATMLELGHAWMAAPER